MANWGWTNYAIEGPTEVLASIYNAIMHHEVHPGSDENWEGNVLKALGLKWLDRMDDRDKGKYMRGFINDPENIEFNPNEDTVLFFSAEEAWGATDFNEVLEENLPVKVYFKVEEHDGEVFATNDKDGKYFPERYYVDACIDGNYESDYFIYKSDAFKWLHKITNGRVNSEETLEQFNADYENENEEENWISFHEFTVTS